MTNHVQTQDREPSHATSPSKRTRLAPALGLFFLAPLVGEFLLGNLPITWLWALITLAPLYGGGALFIRETARRFKLGWPSIVILGLAYAVIEEALVTQSLFNPNYLGLRLLDYGYINRLGIGAWWTVFVLGIHTIWSTAVPIALVETFTPASRHTPWLGRLGFTVAAVLFALGCVMSFTFGQQQDPFTASPTQLMVSAVVVVALVASAIALGRFKSRARFDAEESPGVRVVGVSAFVFGSLFMILTNMPWTVPAGLTVTAMILMLLFGSVSFLRWSRTTEWSERHRYALVSGLLLTYVWYGFVQVPSTGDASPFVDAVGNVILGGCAIILLLIARKRI